MIRQFFSKAKQLGISLLEVLLSLSIIAIILVMATRYFFVASNNNKVNTAISQVGGLIAAAHNWKGIRTSFAPGNTSISISTLYTAGQLESYPGLDIPSGGGAATLSDLWGDPFSIEPTDNDKKAKITVTLPTTGNCKALENAYSGAECSGSTFEYTFS